ncbi:peptide-methionine (S)-S-oxide reductase [Candidatus Saccharibacteria bacterium]|nr:MAG: peptide-methionine (S)-S-oxide reductase [Candidatus Saccharibacteria bacterium]
MASSSIILGGGCFWCLDAVYRNVKGVEDSICGYAGGVIPNPTYDLVCTGQTGHAEVVKVMFDLDIISEHDILDIFWSIHDPTSLNKQGADEGPQYRSIILYVDEEQRERAEESKANAAKLWNGTIVTEIQQLDVFYKAEDVHQNYFANNPERGYCQVVIEPKIVHFRQKFAQLMKE